MSFERRLAKAMFDKADGKFVVSGEGFKTAKFQIGPKVLQLHIWMPLAGFRFGFPQVDITEFKDSQEMGYYYICYHPHPWSWEARIRRRLCKAYRQYVDQQRREEEKDILLAAQGEKRTRLRLISGEE